MRTASLGTIEDPHDISAAERLSAVLIGTEGTEFSTWPLQFSSEMLCGAQASQYGGKRAECSPTGRSLGGTRVPVKEVAFSGSSDTLTKGNESCLEQSPKHDGPGSPQVTLRTGEIGGVRTSCWHWDDEA